MRKNFHDQTPRITSRDLDVLKEVWQYGFRTFRELKKNVLKEHSNSWSWRIMKRLVRLNYLSECKLNQDSYLGWKSGSLKYLPPELRKIRDEISKVKGQSYYPTFAHDEELRDLLDTFKRLPITSSIRAEAELRQEALSNTKIIHQRDLNEIISKIPDGSMTLRLGEKSFNVAIELELNHKSNERVRKKLEYYITKSPYELVIYVCGNEATFRALMRNYHFILSHSSNVKFANSKAPIYFSSLFECKADLPNAQMKGIDNSFKLIQYLKK